MIVLGKDELLYDLQVLLLEVEAQMGGPIPGCDEEERRLNHNEYLRVHRELKAMQERLGKVLESHWTAETN